MCRQRLFNRIQGNLHERKTSSCHIQSPVGSNTELDYYILTPCFSIRFTFDVYVIFVFKYTLVYARITSLYAPQTCQEYNYTPKPYTPLKIALFWACTRNLKSIKIIAFLIWYYKNSKKFNLAFYFWYYYLHIYFDIKRTIPNISSSPFIFLAFINGYKSKVIFLCIFFSSRAFIAKYIQTFCFLIQMGVYN